MKRDRELIDDLIGGTLTQDRLQELTHLIGSDTIGRIQSGEMKLRQHLTNISIESDDVARIAQKISFSQSPSKLLAFLIRWGLLIGIILFTGVLIATFPMIRDLSYTFFRDQTGALIISPLQMSVGIILLVCLGVASWLEWSDKF